MTQGSGPDIEGHATPDIEGHATPDTEGQVAPETESESQATELGEMLRLLAENDPDRARDVVDQLVSAIDQATGGALTDHLGQLGSPNP